jgi:hypothetical protein
VGQDSSREETVVLGLTTTLDGGTGGVGGRQVVVLGSADSHR